MTVKESFNVVGLSTTFGNPLWKGTSIAEPRCRAPRPASQPPFPGDNHRRLRRSSAIKKFGTPVSEFTATGGDAGAGRGCGNTGGSNFRGADDRVTCPGPTRAIPLFRNACDGRRRAD